MKKHKLLSLVLSLILLAGCGSNAMSDGSFPSESEAGLSGYSKLAEADASDTGGTEAFSQEVERSIGSDAESLVEETESHNKQSGDDSQSFQSATETRTDTPVSQSKEPISSPDSTEKPAAEPAVTAPSETEPPILDPIAEPVTETAPAATEPQSTDPAFDVSRYVSYAKSYGAGVGLTLDSTAVSCWDDPITANTSCIYPERDIRDRLDWYLASGFTSFWVWSVGVGGGNYLIYIGYA